MDISTETLEEVKQAMCDEYCKWPNEYNEIQEIQVFSDVNSSFHLMQRIPLEDSDICRSCPLNRL